MKIMGTTVLLLITLLCNAQTNVRAWYADGQVWVVWEISLPLPETYSIYAKPTVFANTADAVLIGRPFHWEYLGGALKEQVDTSLTFRIPDGQGGHYQLAANEGLFVATPHQAGALFFAVVAENEVAVTPGKNITAAAVPFQYDPAGDPVECHLQASFPSPFANGFACFAYYMWADGRQNQWENRPDFPVMANAAKNGMPGFFLVSVPAGLDTTQPFPLSVWLHGGGGTARQSLAGSRAIINIKPVEGILVAQNDDVIGWRDQSPPFFENPSWHFGWRKNYDPFNSGNIPAAPDTIVNYTQRRYLWIDSWLIRRFNADPTRVHIHGHSMGSAGSTALAKCYPEHYASATIFNNGFGGPEPGTMVPLFGEPALDFPTNLKNRAGETVHLLNLFNLLDNCSPERDLPPIRHWHGKNDDNGTMRWDAYVVENYRKADSLGIGVQNMWSERAHGEDTGPAFNDHWVNGNQPTQQTVLDNVSYAEAHLHGDRSFPAFFNHRLDARNNDPGTGLIGINNGDGDNWGAWGGYHRWDGDNITDAPGGWSLVAWLESNAVFVNDNCPENSLTADVAIRKPRQFKPATGKTLNWNVKDAGTGQILQSGAAVVQADGLVVIPQVNVFKENIRRVRISVTDPLVPTEEPANDAFPNMYIAPNPSVAGGAAYLSVYALKETGAEVRATGLDGRQVSIQTRLFEGDNRIPLNAFDRLPAGIYILEISAEEGLRSYLKWVRM